VSEALGSFDEAWNAVNQKREDEAVTSQLRPLLQSVYSEAICTPLRLSTLKHSLENLLNFLTVEGRTNANCWAVDLFICISEGWEKDWADQGLPEDFHDIFVRMGDSLHDTIKNPEIARQYDCLPEQLLERAGKLDT
jgi:hypothetical protein